MAKKKKPDQSRDFAQFLEHRYSTPGDVYKITDAYTGEIVERRASNHYEFNSGVPFAPPIDMPRLSLRERVQRLQGAGVNLDRYVPDDSDDHDFTDPDDAEPMTRAETAYVALNDHIDHLQAERTKPAPAPAPSPSPSKAAVEPPKSGGAGGEAPAEGGS